MISSSLKGNYVLLNNKSPYFKRISQFSMDRLFKLYQNKEEYSKFLDDLASKSKASLVKLYKIYKPWIIKNVVLISKQPNIPLLYGYTDNFILVFLNEETASQDQLKQILGSLFVYIVIHNYKDKNLIPFIVPMCNIYARLISRTTQRPIDTDEFLPDIIRFITAWFLKQYGILSLKTLNIALSNNDVSFVSAEDTQKLFETMNKINRVDQMLENVAELAHTSSNNILMTFTNQYSTDFLIGLENLYHAIYMVTISNILLYPNTLYYRLKHINDKRINEIVKIIFKQIKNLK